MLCYLAHKPEWRNGRRARLKIWYSLSVWVQVPPPVPFTEITHPSTGCFFLWWDNQSEICAKYRTLPLSLLLNRTAVLYFSGNHAVKNAFFLKKNAFCATICDWYIFLMVL